MFSWSVFQFINASKFLHILCFAAFTVADLKLSWMRQLLEVSHWASIVGDWLVTWKLMKKGYISSIFSKTKLFAIKWSVRCGTMLFIASFIVHGCQTVFQSTHNFIAHLYLHHTVLSSPSVSFLWFNQLGYTFEMNTMRFRPVL